jgi:hypothetical protein
MTWKLSKAAAQMREQIDDSYPERSRKSDGTLGDLRHLTRKSDHNPDANGWVRALDVTADLGVGLDETADLVEQIRKYAKRAKRKRIAYIIYNGRIASPILNWKWRKYRGSNPHKSHWHLSFTTLGDEDGSFFNIPMLGGTNERVETNGRKLGKNLFGNRTGNIYGSRLRCADDRQCCYCCRIAEHN